MSQIRQLAAIMFTDIVGYTALMGLDEQKAFSILKNNREIQKPIIALYHGRWIKEIGDGIMATFIRFLMLSMQRSKYRTLVMRLVTSNYA
jgi:class 3 adenylate cyclase